MKSNKHTKTCEGELLRNKVLFWTSWMLNFKNWKNINWEDSTTLSAAKRKVS